MTETPRITVASSSEQIKVARKIATALEETKEWTVHVWDELFNFSNSYIESLEDELELADFAVVVLTGNDAANVRKKAVVLPRDNVIFELGLFIGRLGRSRCFFFVDAESGTQIASDLSGVKPVRFYPNAFAANPGKPSLKTQANRVKKQLRELGVRYKPNRKAREQQEALWRFSRRVMGHWWERMRDGEDDQSALSYVALTTDETTGMLHLEGQAYGLAGRPLAGWESIASRIVLGTKPKIQYLWGGQRMGTRAQELAGHGVIEFDDDRLESGGGYFYDTNFTAIKDGTAPTREKNIRLYRCSADEVQKMRQPTSAAANALIKNRLRALRWP